MRLLRISHQRLSLWLRRSCDGALGSKSAVGTCRGLLYLHEGCQRRIIHRDIKAANILLNEEFELQRTTRMKPEKILLLFVCLSTVTLAVLGDATTCPANLGSKCSDFGE